MSNLHRHPKQHHSRSLSARQCDKELLAAVGLVFEKGPAKFFRLTRIEKDLNKEEIFRNEPPKKN